MAGQPESSRINQKSRTRADLLRAARSMIERGASPSVASVADAAGISRATAYRYFSTPETLIQEAILDAVANDTVEVPPSDSGLSPASRLDAVVHQAFSLVTKNEAVFRAYLANSLGSPTPPQRGGRRLEWVAQALDGLQPDLPEMEFQRLVHALALLTGIETLVVLRDVCGLANTEAEAVTRWAAQALLKSAAPEGKSD